MYIPFRIFDELIFDTTRTIELIALTVTVSTIGMLTYLLFATLLDVKELYMLQKVAVVFTSWKKYLSRTTESMETAGQSDESVM